MTDLDTMYNTVKDIMAHDVKARGNDMYLYVQVSKLKNVDAIKMPFYVVMCDYSKYGLPNYETVSRARRKVQSEHPELKPCEAIQNIREENEQLFFSWATGGVNE